MKIFKRWWGGKKALVLGGGSARGLAHIGVIKVLQEENVTFDAVFGTSMGAIIGALYSAGMNWREMADRAEDFSFSRFFKWRISKTGLIRSENVIQYLGEVLPVTAFEDLSPPLYVVAADITKGCDSVFSRGDLSRKVAASCSIPGIFTPVEIDGSMYVDGGMMHNVPVLVARQNGYKRTLAVNVLNYFYGGEITGIMDVMTRSLGLLAHKAGSYDFKKASLLLNPHLEEYGSMDYKKARWIIMEGEESARRHLKNIRALF